MTEWKEIMFLLNGSREAGRIAAQALAEFPFFSGSSGLSISEVFHGMKSFRWIEPL